jgi:hypothetical protein
VTSIRRGISPLVDPHAEWAFLLHCKLILQSQEGQ